MNNQKTGVICFTMSWLYMVSSVCLLPFPAFLSSKHDLIICLILSKNH